MPKGEYLQYGGLALIEAIMMRTPKFYAVACRAPNGEIILFSDPMEKTWIGRQQWVKLPFIRGVFGILDSMILGNKCMKLAAFVQQDEAFMTAEQIATRDAEQLGKMKGDTEALKLAQLENKKNNEKKATAFVIALAVIIGLSAGFFIFNILPNAVAEMTQRKMGQTDGTFINYVAEIIKMIVFIGYLWLISLLPDIKEVFRYHGAEHKAINVLEAGQEMTKENVLKQSRIHPRCGTSFAIIVLLLSLIFMPLVPRYPITGTQGNPWQDIPVRILVELFIFPIISGIAYELLRLAGKWRNQSWVNFAFAPGMWTQRITTKEPNEKHVECAIEALNEVIRMEAGEPGRGQSISEVKFGV